MKKVFYLKTCDTCRKILGQYDTRDWELREIKMNPITAEEVEELRRQGYKPREYYEKDEELHQVLTQIGSGVFSPEDPGRYRDLVDSLINFGDHYQVLADYRSYVDCQDKVDELYELQEEWTAKAMLNIANMGYFSSDRTIKEYADHIWHIDPVRL